MMEMRITGTEEVMRRLTGLSRELHQENIRAMEASVIYITNVSKQDYLSGPRPEKLDVVTGRLRSSVNYKVTGEGNDLKGIVGTNVVYGRIHELGGYLMRHGDIVGFMPARPFLSAALQAAHDFVIERFGRGVQAVISRGGR